jgi:protein SCO1/2
MLHPSHHPTLHRPSPLLARARRDVLLLVALLGSLVASAAPAREFHVRGIVRAPYADGAIRIQHEEIPGFMPAMTMPFFVDADEVSDLRPGDRVEFKFVVAERSRATAFRRTGREMAAATAGSSSPSPHVRRLRPGDALPAVTLRDEQDSALGEEWFDGRHTVLTFMFTRCPVPEFCPLLAQKFGTLQTLLATRGRDDVRLLSVTLDPAHDQPDVLRAYAAAVGADAARWSFATGKPAEIEQLTRALAVRTERDGAVLNHALATVLIGPDRRVVEIWRGQSWKPEEILARLPAK